ncbi:hypothetical protein ACHFCA_27480 [Delftia tsuruhatensis]
MGKDFYIQPDAADPVLDPDAVLAIVRLHAAGAKAVRAVDESGGEARAYAIDNGLILKVQRPQQLRARTSLAKERFLWSSWQAWRAYAFHESSVGALPSPGSSTP